MKTLLTWITPSADQIHIWNFFGAVKPLLDMQKENNIYFMIADLHAFISKQEKDFIHQASLNQAKIYIASWLDLEKVILFRQHKVAAHSQLNWILSCLTTLWVLKRMHAFKDKAWKWKQENISAGLFNYPTLMAADILLYEPDLIPVWQDQKQHLEYTQDIAEKFNRNYWEVFKIPKEYINKEVPTITWIDGRKMSKSYNNFIWLLDSEEEILKKTKRVLTDSIPLWTAKNPDECNLYNMLKLFLNEEENKTIREKYNTWNFSFKEMKELLFEKIMNFVRPIQEKYNNLTDEEVIKILEKNEEKANKIANEKIQKVYDAIWI